MQNNQDNYTNEWTGKINSDGLEGELKRLQQK